MPSASPDRGETSQAAGIAALIAIAQGTAPAGTAGPAARAPGRQRSPDRTPAITQVTPVVGEPPRPVRSPRGPADRQGKHRLVVPAPSAGWPGPRHRAADLSRPPVAWPAGQSPERDGSRETPRLEFRTVFEPVVDLVSDMIVGHDALVRVEDGWTPDSRPARCAGTSVDVTTEGALARAAIAAAAALPPPGWVAVETSGRLLAADPGLVNWIGALARPVVLLIRESARPDLGASLGWLPDRLPANASLGLRHAGFDSTSLSQLARLRPAFIRIERDALTQVESDLDRQQGIATLVSAAQKYGGKVIATGIETRQERAVLRRLGVHGGRNCCPADRGS